MGKKTITTIAKQLVAKNSNITTIIDNAPDGQSYKALAPVITARLCGVIGKAEDQYIKRNELIWACINEVNDEEAELAY